MTDDFLPSGDQRPINKQDRCPVVMVLDVSSSMTLENRIAQLNDGLGLFKDELCADPLSSVRVDVAVVTFGSYAELQQDFITAKEYMPASLSASGSTAMGEAVNKALDIIEERKQWYKDNGITYFRPWLWLMTDGMPNDASWENAAERLSKADIDGKVIAYSVGIGDQADLETLKKFSPNAAPLRLQPGKFQEMFEWLSASLKKTSQSVQTKEDDKDGVTAITETGEPITFDPPGWGTIR